MYLQRVYVESEKGKGVFVGKGNINGVRSLHDSVFGTAYNGGA